MTSATLWIRTTSTGPTGKESSAITAAVILLTASSPGPDQVKHPGMKRSPRAAAEESVKSGTGISCSNARGRTSSPRIMHCRPPRRAHRLGLSGTERKLLDVLDRLGPSTAGALAAHTGLTTEAITGVVDRLVRAGYARREPNLHDRRQGSRVSGDAAAAVSSSGMYRWGR
jgi:hypothetical protein